MYTYYYFLLLEGLVELLCWCVLNVLSNDLVTLNTCQRINTTEIIERGFADAFVDLFINTFLLRSD